MNAAVGRALEVARFVEAPLRGFATIYFTAHLGGTNDGRADIQVSLVDARGHREAMALFDSLPEPRRGRPREDGTVPEWLEGAIRGVPATLWSRP